MENKARHSCLCSFLAPFSCPGIPQTPAPVGELVQIALGGVTTLFSGVQSPLVLPRLIS